MIPAADVKRISQQNRGDDKLKQIQELILQAANRGDFEVEIPRNIILEKPLIEALEDQGYEVEIEKDEQRGYISEKIIKWF